MGDRSAVIKYKFAENKSLYVLPCICNIKIIRWQETIEIQKEKRKKPFPRKIENKNKRGGYNDIQQHLFLISRKLFRGG